jgi:hypothetical protein
LTPQLRQLLDQPLDGRQRHSLGVDCMNVALVVADREGGEVPGHGADVTDSGLLRSAQDWMGREAACSSTASPSTEATSAFTARSLYSGPHRPSPEVPTHSSVPQHCPPKLQRFPSGMQHVFS